MRTLRNSRLEWCYSYHSDGDRFSFKFNYSYSRSYKNYSCNKYFNSFIKQCYQLF